MRNLAVLTVREWKAFWYSPIAYVVGAFFLLLQGFVFWLLIAFLNDPRADGSWNMAQLFFGTFFYWFCMLMLPPVLTMRALSEEKRTGTIEVLLSAPVRDLEVVISKFLGSWLSFCALWASTAVFFLLLWRFAAIDWGQVLGGYLGTFLLGGAFISVGILASSLTRNQVISAVIGFVLVLMMFSVGLFGNLVTDPDSQKWIGYLSVWKQIFTFSKGIIDSRPIVFDASVITVALFLAGRVIASPRWRS